MIAWESQEYYRYYFPALSLPFREGSLAGARALLEGDLAAIEGGTVASFTLSAALPPLARATPVNGGHRTEYGCRAEEHGIRANRMPNPKR